MAKFSLPSVLQRDVRLAGGQEGGAVRGTSSRRRSRRPRRGPVSPVYPQISQAVYKNVNKALSGQTSPEDALKQGQDEIEKALNSVLMPSRC